MVQPLRNFPDAFYLFCFIFERPSMGRPGLTVQSWQAQRIFLGERETFLSHGRFLQLSWASAGGCPKNTRSPFAIPQSHQIGVCKGFP